MVDAASSFASAATEIALQLLPHSALSPRFTLIATHSSAGAQAMVLPAAIGDVV
jgi:hypothetical protein